MKKEILLLAGVLLASIIKAQIGINTEAPEASLHVRGSMIVTNTPSLSNVYNYLATDSSGLVGYTNQIPVRGVFLQGKNEQEFTTEAERTALNNGTGVVVKWSEADIVTNNIVSIDEANAEIVILNGGRYDINGSINYVSDATNIAGQGTAVKIAIECKKVGASTWTTINSGRFFHNYPSLDRTTYSFVLPSTATDLSIGDRLRVTLARPNNIGSIHGSYEGRPRVALPQGTSFTRSLRLILF